MTKYMDKRFRKRYKILDKQKSAVAESRAESELKLIEYELMGVGIVFAIFLVIMFLGNLR